MDFALVRLHRSAFLPLLSLILALALRSPPGAAHAQSPTSSPVAASSPATPRPTDSRITQVTVFRDVAQVTRTAALDLAAGNHTLAFTGLPLGRELDALDCRVAGEARVLALRIEPKSPKPAPERVKSLNERLSTLDGELGTLAAEVKVLDEKREFLTGVRTEAPKAMVAHTTAPAAILVLDQVPVAADERVRVEVLTLAPPPQAGTPDERGALTWSLGVPPGQEVAIDLAYKVRCPREFGLAGL